MYFKHLKNSNKNILFENEENTTLTERKEKRQLGRYL